MTAYVDLATVKLALGVTDTGRDTLIQNAIDAACALIDDQTGRTFGLDVSATAREYRVLGRVVCDRDGEALIVDDIGDEAGLLVEVGDGTTWTTLDAGTYDIEPDNAIAHNRPVTRLRYVYGWWTGYRKARITARWGWPATPAEIAQAAQIQAERLYRRKDSPEGVAGSSDWGLVRVPNVDPDVRALLAPFMLPGFG